MDEVVECHEKNVRLKSSLFVYDEYWTRVLGYIPRLLESVILKPGEKEHLTQDIEKFKTSKRRYCELGVPYHRGYLLYGPPGTGKSSLASALAQRFGMSVYAINLNDFNDRTLMMAINEVPPNSVILFEDIDCMSSGKARVAPSEWSSKKGLTSCDGKDEVLDRLGVTLSGLLNVLDGFSAPENVLMGALVTAGHDVVPLSISEAPRLHKLPDVWHANHFGIGIGDQKNRTISPNSGRLRESRIADIAVCMSCLKG